MANTDNTLSKIKTFFDKLFKSFDNLISGYTTKDNEITRKSGTVTYKFILAPNAELGNDKNISVELTATNVGSAFKEYTQAIPNLTYDKLKNKGDQSKKLCKTLTKLIGDLSDPDNCPVYWSSADNDELAGDLSIKDGCGLLGVRLSASNETELNDLFNNPNFAPWREAAFSHLIFDLTCESEDSDTGEVTGQRLALCPKWLYTYINYIKQTSDVSETSRSIDELQPIEGEDASADTTNKQNIRTTALALVLPILATIQEQLVKLYNEQLIIEDSLDNIVNDNSDKTEEGNEEPEAGNEEPEGESKEAEDTMKQNNSGDVNESKKITVKLQKVEGSIDLLGIKSNYSPSDTLSDLDDIINQDEFIEALGDAPESYDILVDENGYDIEQCDDCCISCCEGIGNILQTGIEFYRNLYILHWMAKGNDMMKLHLMTEEMYGELIQEIDTLGELMVEKCGTVISPSFGCNYLEIKNYEFQEGLDIIVNYIQQYLDSIDYAYPNQTSDVQSTLDEYIRYWNKQMNYFVGRQEV